MSKGTIIYIGGFQLPDRNAAAHRVLSNGKILKELDYNVVFIDVDTTIQYGNDILNTKKDIQGFNCWSAPYPKSYGQWFNYLSSINSIIKVLSQYSDVKAVICYNYQAVALMKLKKFCSKNNIKVLADCTEWYSTKGANILFKIIKNLDSFLRMRIIQKKLNGLIVISRYLEKFYRNCSNVICIPPLVDLSEKKWEIEEVLGVNYIDDKIVIVYAGSPGKNKDKINIIIEVLYELSNIYSFEFYVVGVSKKEYLDNYRKHNEILNKLNGHVKFLGRLNHFESIRYIKMADYTMFIRDVNRTNNAGFPTKFVESISCGTPTITTKTSDLEEYLVDGENGYFIDTEKKEEIITNLKKILEKRNYQFMKDKNIDSKIFDYKNYVEQVRGFMNKI